MLRPNDDFVRGAFAVLIEMSEDGISDWLALTGDNFGVIRWFEDGSAYMVTPKGRVYSEDPARWIVEHRDELKAVL